MSSIQTKKVLNTIINDDCIKIMNQMEENSVDLIFADPPYANSAELFHRLISDETFINFCHNSRIIWELPDTPGAMGEFINIPAVTGMQFRRFGKTIFLTGTIK